MQATNHRSQEVVSLTGSGPDASNGKQAAAGHPSHDGLKGRIGELKQQAAELVRAFTATKWLRPRRRVNQELAEASFQFQALLDNIPDRIFFKDTQSRFLKLNQALARRLGVADPAQAVGKTDFDFQLHERAREFHADEQRIMQTGEALINKTEKQVMLNGQTTWTSTTKVPIRDLEGRIIGLVGVNRDITQQKRAEERLREYEKVMESSDEMITVVDRNYRYVIVNRLFLRYREMEENQVVGKPVADILGRTVFETVVKPKIDECLQGKVVHYEMRHAYPGLGKRDLFISYFPIQGHDGIDRVACILRDITEHKLAQKALQLFRFATDQAAVAVFWATREAGFNYVNDEACRSLGYSREELMRLRVFDIVPSFSKEQWGESWNQLDGKPVTTQQLETIHRRKDGSTFPVEIVAKHFAMDGVDLRVAFVRDITGRKQVEERLDRERRLLRTLVDNLPDSIYVKDTAGRKILANPVDLKCLGCQTEAEALGKTDFDFYPQDVAANFHADDQKVFQGQQVTKQEERDFGGAKEKRWVWTSKLPLRDQSGKVIGLVGIGRDITERKQVEERLARERTLLRTLIDNLPDSIFAKDTAGRKTLANPVDLKYLHCRTEAEAIGKTDFDFYPPDIAAIFHADDQQVIQGQPVLNREERNFGEMGENRWVLTSKLPLRDQSGKIVGLIGVGRDITERKLAEEKLRQSEGDLAEAQRAAKLGSWRFDIATNAVRWSDELYRIFEIEKEAFADTYEAFLSLVHPEDQPRVLQINAEAKATGKSFEMEYRVQTRTGGLKIVHETGYAMKDATGKITGLFGTAQDITEHRRAEEKIHEQATLLDEASDAIWTMDLNERISYWNKGAERIYGWTAAEAVGKNPVELLCGGNNITSQSHECIKAVRERGEWVGELEQFTKDGKTIIVQVRSNAIRDEQGRRKSVLIISTDITEKKKLETQFLRSQRMDSLGALAGGIAHDLNNVLTPLMFSVQMLKEKITDADGQKLLHALEASVERGARLVKQVLTFGRGIQGERVSVQPAYLIREIRQIIHETFPKSVEFECDCPSGLWAITGDSTQLYQVLLNLCVNARDAMPGGGKLSIRLKNAVLDDNYSRMNPESKPGPFVVFEVTDTGAGIPKEIQDRIFEPFFTTKKSGRGTGLGLSTTLGIVKSHGGFINCYSEPGQGSTFKVYLPANTAPEVADKAAEPTELPRGRGELVLLVDDEQNIREVAQKTLERFGYRVLLAANGAEAISLYTARRDEIAVVLTDMAMPVMDGPAAIAALQSINPEVKIIGSSGFGSKYVASQANSTETGHFIRKPYTTAAMLHALHVVLHETAA